MVIPTYQWLIKSNKHWGAWSLVYCDLALPGHGPWSSSSSSSSAEAPGALHRAHMNRRKDRASPSTSLSFDGPLRSADSWLTPLDGLRRHQATGLHGLFRGLPFLLLGLQVATRQVLSVTTITIIIYHHLSSLSLLPSLTSCPSSPSIINIIMCIIFLIKNHYIAQYAWLTHRWTRFTHQSWATTRGPSTGPSSSFPELPAANWKQSPFFLAPGHSWTCSMPWCSRLNGRLFRWWLVMLHVWS